MSSGISIPLSPQLLSTWKAQRAAGTMRALKIQITNEECVLADTAPKTAHVEQDFGSLMAFVSPAEPCFVLFRLDDKASWLLVSFIPDKSRVTDKLVYAASSSALRRDLGASVVDEVQFSALTELNWASYKATKAKVECSSEREQQIAALDQQEAIARKEQEEDARAKAQAPSTSPPPAVKSPRSLPLTPGAKSPAPVAAKSPTATRPAAAAPAAAAPAKAAPAAAAAPAKPSSVASPVAAPKSTTPPAGARPVGQVKPLQQPLRQASTGAIKATPANARTQVQGAPVDSLRSAFESGTTSPVESGRRSPVPSEPIQEEGVKVSGIGGYHTVRLPWNSAAQDALRKLSHGQVNLVALKVNEEEVQLDRAESLSSPSALPGCICTTEPRFYFFAKPGTVYFIYSCPDKSRARSRMVYSTCKPTIAQEAGTCGVRVSKKMEIRDPQEVSPQQLEDAIRPVSEADFRSANPNRKSMPPQMQAPHPICQLLEGQTSTGGKQRKSIIMPPSGAW